MPRVRLRFRVRASSLGVRLGPRVIATRTENDRMSASPPPTGMHVRVSQILRVRKIWLLPVAIAAVFVALMSAIYFGSVVNPTGHLRGLPVMVVNEDTGASAPGQRLSGGAGAAQTLHAAEKG